MKIHPVGAEWSCADGRTVGQTDKHDEANSRLFAMLRTRLVKESSPAAFK